MYTPRSAAEIKKAKKQINRYYQEFKDDTKCNCFMVECEAASFARICRDIAPATRLKWDKPGTKIDSVADTYSDGIILLSSGKLYYHRINPKRGTHLIFNGDSWYWIFPIKETQCYVKTRETQERIRYMEKACQQHQDLFLTWKCNCTYQKVNEPEALACESCGEARFWKCNNTLCRRAQPEEAIRCTDCGYIRV